MDFQSNQPRSDLSLLYNIPKLLDLPGLQFPLPRSEDNNTYYIGLL